MSYAAPYDASHDYTNEALPAANSELHYLPRSKYQWIPMVFPVLCCGGSWALRGEPLLTDVGFAALVTLCSIFLISEFARFSRRFGIGGIVLYGGVLIWFCHDYFSNWFGRSFQESPIPAEIIAKAAFFHCLFILMMTLGLQIKRGRLIQRAVLSVPEPESENFYLILVGLMQIVGLSPFFFAQSDPFYVGMYKAVFSAWSGMVNWTVFRSGNMNFRWDAYVAQVIQVGEVGGIFASLFAVIVSTRLWTRILAWGIWLFWALFVFNGGRRGEFAYMVLPPIGLLFIKYQSRAASGVGRAQVFKSYLAAGVLSVLLLLVVQIQGMYRAIGYDKTDLSQINLLSSRGNTMFSEGLLAWRMIPDERPFFKNNRPLEGLIRPIPEQIFWFTIGPIPRVLWPNKPVDELWEWYNAAATGGSNGRVGTTVSHGLVGSWYFNYGFWGVIEGGLVVGWLMAVSESALIASGGRPVGMMMSLGMCVWLFRIYRDFIFIDLYGLMIGGVVLSVLVRMFRPIMGSSPGLGAESPHTDPSTGSQYADSSGV